MPGPISPVGPAIHGDFYAVTGSGIPDDVELVFQSAAVTVKVKPKLVRPHWVFLARLPNNVPLGPNRLTLKARGWSSDPVPVDVADNPKSTVRVLHPGPSKPAPYTVVFVANPAVASMTGKTVHPDPVLTNRSGFHAAVGNALSQLLDSKEDLLRQFDASMRFVAIFDHTAPATDGTALAQRIPGQSNMLDPRADRVKAFLADHGVEADVAFVVHDDEQFNRAKSRFTTDDPGRPHTTVTYDGLDRTHFHFAELPGVVVFPLGAGEVTALHEFCHAASDYDNGLVIDLYVDPALPGFTTHFTVNKKWRTTKTKPVPPDFASYQGVDYESDLKRDGLGYKPSWTSYHPELADAARPNLMDDYTQEPNPRKCRLDTLTHAWLTDRLRAKVLR